MLRRFIIIMAALFVVHSGAFAAQNTQVKIYVSQSGSDSNNGSSSSPFASIERARQEVRKYTASVMMGDIEVIIGEGTYLLDKTLEFSPEDSGNNRYKVFYRGVNQPTVSGGIKVTGFEETADGMWKTSVPELDVMRELYVNGSRVYRASTEREITGLGNYNNPGTGYTYDGIYFDKNDLGLYENSEDMSFRQGIGWKGHEMRVEKIIQDPANSTRVIAIMQQPSYEHEASCPDWGHPMRYDFGFRAENAFELLDMPGEYYFNEKTKELFYIPREGEDINTAEVYAPRLERLMQIYGDDENQVQYIEFEGITFAHATFLMPDRIGYSVGQWNDTHVSDSKDELLTHGAVEVNNANNIYFRKCIIYGTGAAGLSMRYSVYDSGFTGGAVYDTNSSGVIIGSPYSDINSTVKPEDFIGDAMDCARIEVSSGGGFGSGVQEIYHYTDAASWIPKNDISNKTKAWVKIDFGKEISVDEILLTISSEDGSANKRNFEMLLSNDADFSEKLTVYTQGTRGFDGTEFSVKPGVSEKFRYLMIRKTVGESFAITHINVFSKDIAWQPMDICKNIEISNNYMTRLANYFYGSPGIAAYYTQDLTISHNEISELPYSGIGTGWGWSNKISSDRLARTKILNNRIYRYNMEAQDGGALYTLGRSEDSVIEGNYFSDEHAPFGAFYFDEGSADFTMKNNVAENSSHPVFIWTDSIMDITATNTYSNSAYIRNLGKNTNVEAMKNYIKGNPSPQAKAIMDNAGVQPEFSGIKEFVPEGEAYFGRYAYDDCSSIYHHYTGGYYGEWAVGIESAAKTALSLANTGDMPGQYSAQKKLELQKRIDELCIDYDAFNMMERTLRMQQAQAEFEESLHRLSYAETLSFAENLAENNNANIISRYIFKTTVNNIKKSSDDEYSKIRKLEDAINTLELACTKAEIKGFVPVGDDLRTVIDKENKVITVYADEGRDLTNVKAYTEISRNSRMSVDFSAGVDLSEPIQVTVTNGSVKSIWTVKAEKAEDAWKNPESWWNWHTKTPVATGEELVFEPSDRPYMYLAEKQSNIGMKLRAEKLDNQNGIGIIFLAENSRLDDGTYFELRIRKDSFDLYKSTDGEVQKIKSSNNEVVKNNTAEVGIIAQEEDGKIRIRVNVNDKCVMSELCEAEYAEIKGFYGIRTDTADVTVYEMIDEVREEWNVAEGKKVTVSSVYGGTVMPGENAVDGDINSAWANGYYPNGANFMQIDLQAEYNISEIRFYINNIDGYRKSFDILLSKTPDFSEAVTVYSLGETAVANQQWHIIPVAQDDSYRYVRAVKTDGVNTVMQFNEFMVMTGDGEVNYDGLENLALDKPVTTAYNNQYYKPSYAVDGDYGSCWVGGDYGTSIGSIQIDLGEDFAKYQLEQINVLLSAEKFKITLSDGLGGTKEICRETGTYGAQKAVKLDLKELLGEDKIRTYRYVTVSHTDFATAGKTAPITVYEVEVYGKKFTIEGEIAGTGMNIMPYAEITTTGDHESGWYPVSNVRDNAWHDGTDGEQWKSGYAATIGKSVITIDLGAEYDINAIVFQMGAHNVNGFIVEIAQKRNFEDAFTVHRQNSTNYSGINAYSFDKAKSCRYVRFRTPDNWFNGSNNFDVFSIGEIKIYSEDCNGTVTYTDTNGMTAATIPGSGELCVKLSYNNFGDAKEAEFFWAQFAENGRLIKVNKKEIGFDAKTVNGEILISETAEKSAAFCKSFVWNEDGKPYAAALLIGR